MCRRSLGVAVSYSSPSQKNFSYQVRYVLRCVDSFPVKVRLFIFAQNGSLLQRNSRKKRDLLLMTENDAISPGEIMNSFDVQ